MFWIMIDSSINTSKFVIGSFQTLAHSCITENKIKLLRAKKPGSVALIFLFSVLLVWFTVQAAGVALSERVNDGDEEQGDHEEDQLLKDGGEFGGGCVVASARVEAGALVLQHAEKGLLQFGSDATGDIVQPSQRLAEI